MKLQKFIKNKKQKGIVIGSIVGILLLIGGISLYRSFALYKVEKTFDVLEGTVPDFNSGDVTLAFTINNRKTNGVPFPNSDEGFTSKETKCEEGVQAEWIDTNWALKVINSNNQSRIKCTIDFNAPTFSTYLKSKVTSVADGGSGFIKQEHEATEQTQSNATTDYRFIGVNPNNYICLEESGQCNDESLYRIIGVIPTQSSDSGNYEDRVKLIKNTSIGKYPWSGSTDNNSNDWTQSTLNIDTLNKTYWDSISSYQKYIENAKWYLGSYWEDDRETRNITDFYISERGKRENTGESTINYILTKIGLIYESDFVFATSMKNECSVIGSWNTNCSNNDWLYKTEKYQWSITAQKFTLNQVWFITNSSIEKTIGLNTSTNEDIDVFPAFYLKSNVLFQNGNGTKSNPYRISIN